MVLLFALLGFGIVCAFVRNHVRLPNHNIYIMFRPSYTTTETAKKTVMSQTHDNFFHNCNNLFKSYNGQRYSVSVVVKSLTGLAWHTHIHRGSVVAASLTCGQNAPFLPYSWGSGHSRSIDD